MTLECPPNSKDQTKDPKKAEVSLAGYVANLSAAMPDPIPGESSAEYAHRADVMANTLSLLGFDEM